jgi:hypothetical protein
MVNAAERPEEGSQTWNVWISEFNQCALKTRTEIFGAPSGRNLLIGGTTFHVWLPSYRRSPAG